MGLLTGACKANAQQNIVYLVTITEPAAVFSLVADLNQITSQRNMGLESPH